MLYDAIGCCGLNAEDFAKELKALKAKTINLRINSPGGDVFAARAMVAAIRDVRASGRSVIAHIDGLAASAATYVAIAADEVRAEPGSFFMIHNAWGLAIGNADELRETAALLDKVDDTIVADYAKKTGKTDDQIRSWMAAETWFTAEEAQAEGFIDSVKVEDEEPEESEEEEIPEDAEEEEEETLEGDEPEEEDEEAQARWREAIAAFKNAPEAVRQMRPAARNRKAKKSAVEDIVARNERRLKMLEMIG